MRGKLICGAHARSTGKPCQAKALKFGGRCKFHGGLSTGPKSETGRVRSLSNLRQYRAADPAAIRAHVAARIAQDARTAGWLAELGVSAPREAACILATPVTSAKDQAQLEKL